MPYRLPWRKPAVAQAMPEKKAAQYGFVALHMEGEARWTRRDYGGLAREGFMRNPVAHRCVRLIAEAAAAMPWRANTSCRNRDGTMLRSTAFSVRRAMRERLR